MRWSRARSLDTLGELTAQWLEGNRRHPSYPEPDPETAQIHDALIRLNCSGGVVTLSSQPGEDDEAGEQRAAVEAVAAPQRTEEIAAAARAARMQVLVSTPPRWWAKHGVGGVDVSRRVGGEVVTDFGVSLSVRVISRILGSPSAAALRDIRQITVIDPRWGPHSDVWTVLAPGVSSDVKSLCGRVPYEEDA